MGSQLRKDQIKLALDVLAELVIDDRAAVGPRGRLGTCPWCGGREWFHLTDEGEPPAVGHDAKCPVNRARVVLKEIIGR